MINLTDIDYLGIERVLKRGTGEIIASHENAFLVRDKVSKAYFLACEDEMLGMTLLDQHVHEDCHLLMVTDFKLGRYAFENMIFQEKLDVFKWPTTVTLNTGFTDQGESCRSEGYSTSL